MRKRLVAVVLSAVIVTTVPVGTAGASPPLAVHFDVPTTFAGPNFFTASGAAVDAGVVCTDGDVIDLFNKASGFQSGLGINFQVVKEFRCEDGSGSFIVKLQARLNFRAGTDNFAWVIVGGSDAYTDLHGSGSGVGIDPAPEFIHDVYDGGVHVD